MRFNNIAELINESIENIKKLIDIDAVMGKPIEDGETTIIPVSKMTVGFVSGGANKFTEKENGDEFPIGASGGGINVMPIGFLVIRKDGTNFIKTQGDNVDKWLDIVQSSIKSIMK